MIIPSFIQIEHVTELDPQQSNRTVTMHLRHDTRMNFIHPLTFTTDRYAVGDRFHDGVKTGYKKDAYKYHHMDLRPELSQLHLKCSIQRSSMLLKIHPGETYQGSST